MRAMIGLAASVMLFVATVNLIPNAARASETDAALTPEDIEKIPADELREQLYVVRKQALLVNLARARTPADWLRVPGVKGAWKNFGQRGKTV